MSRDDLKELGECLDAGQPDLSSSAPRTWRPRSSERCAEPRRSKKKQLKADLEEIERDAKTSAPAGE